MISVPTFVIHVKGCKEREHYISNELNKHAITFEFMLDGNKEDITEEILSLYFSDFMHEIKAATSCALKHFLVYERMIADKIPYALILEDDISLNDSFSVKFEESLQEIREKGLDTILVSYENSDLKYVKKSQLKENQLLYKESRGRCTGAYLIDLQAATAMIKQISLHKCSSPIDWFHNKMTETGKLNIYWCHPHLAEQKSHNGTMASLIDVSEKSFLRKITYQINKLYKQHVLYKLR